MASAETILTEARKYLGMQENPMGSNNIIFNKKNGGLHGGALFYDTGVDAK